MNGCGRQQHKSLAASHGPARHGTDPARSTPRALGRDATECATRERVSVMKFGEILAADGDMPAHGLPGADLNVTTSQAVVVSVIGGYEQGGGTPAVSYSAPSRTCLRCAPPLWPAASTGCCGAALSGQLPYASL